MIRYLKRAIEDILDNKFLNVITIITIAVSILIVSAFALFFINTSDLLNAWKKGIRVMAYLKPDVPAIKIPEISQKIKGLYGVQDTRYISKTEALEHLKTLMKRQASLFANLKENPLPDAFEIRMVPASRNQDKIEKLSSELERFPEIEEVEYGQQWIARFSNIFNLFRLISFAMGGLFFMATVFIVANTIRLVLYSRREEIEVMRLVGATDNFIKTPFYIEGIIQGAAGGAIGLAVLFAGFMAVSSNVEQGFAAELFTIRFLPLKVCGGILWASMFVGWLGCYFSLKQFLKP